MAVVLTLTQPTTDRWSFDNIATSIFNQMASMDAAIKTAMGNIQTTPNTEDFLAMQFQIGQYTAMTSCCTETVKACKECMSEITRNLS
jgi:hypothetical protein